MPIPDLNAEGLLPVGIHQATLIEVKEIFGDSSERRMFLMKSLIIALSNLYMAGAVNVWIDGSFVTVKEIPGDIDVCWEYHPNIDFKILDPIFLKSQEEIKKNYGLHVFPTGVFVGEDWVSFFQRVKRPVTARFKGILFVKLSLEDLISLK